MPVSPTADTGAIPLPVTGPPLLLADRLRRSREHLVRLLPVTDLAVLTEEIDRLERAVAAPGSRRLEPGDTLPIATLPDHRGRPVRVAEPGRAAVVLLVRGAWCPFDNLALAAYQRQLLPELRERDVALMALSPQVPDAAESMVLADGLDFDLLTDGGGAYARRLGLVHDLTPAVSAVHRRLGNDFSRLHLGGEWALPHPTTIVINAAGVVRFLQVHADYTRRAEPARILAAVRDLG